MIKILNVLNKQNIICAIIIILLFGIDRLSKIKILNNFSENYSFYINDYLNIDLIWNTGIGFGLFNLNAGLIYHSVTIFIFLIILFILYLMVNSPNKEKLYYSTLVGGAFGNFYDRSTYFAVPDFIDLHINNFHWFTFNIADIFITIGVLLLIFNETLKKENDKK